MIKINGKGTPQNLISTVVSPSECTKMFMRSISFYTNKKVSTCTSVITQGEVHHGSEEWGHTPAVVQTHSVGHSYPMCKFTLALLPYVEEGALAFQSLENMFLENSKLTFGLRRKSRKVFNLIIMMNAAQNTPMMN